jgi:hypothetical protein
MGYTWAIPKFTHTMYLPCIHPIVLRYDQAIVLSPILGDTLHGIVHMWSPPRKLETPRRAT